MHQRNDHADTEPERHRPRDRAAGQPPQRRIAELAREWTEQSVAVNGFTRWNVVLDPLEARGCRARLTHGFSAAVAAPVSSRVPSSFHAYRALSCRARAPARSWLGHSR